MDLRALQCLAHDLQGQSEATIDRSLRERHLSPEERIGVKHMLAAVATQRYIDAQTGDSPRVMEPVNEVDRWATRAGIDLTRPRGYTIRELDDILDHLPGGRALDATQRIALKHRLEELGKIIGGSRSMLHASHGHTIEASVEKHPTLLMDESGRPRTLRGYSW